MDSESSFCFLVAVPILGLPLATPFCTLQKWLITLRQRFDLHADQKMARSDCDLNFATDP